MAKRLLILFFILFSGFIHSQSFTSIWNTINTSSGSSANNEVTIPTNPAFTTYNYTINWGDGDTDTNITGDITHVYAAPDTYTIEITGIFPSIYFNEAGDRNKIIEILSWGNIQWQSMENSFYGCENVNFDAIDAPDLSQVKSLKNMFRECTAFNGIVNNWDISTITDISGLFAEAFIFNRPLDGWNTINVTDMSWTFHRARQFNEPLDNWNTASVNTLEYSFSEAGSFNQNINNWDVTQVTNMSGTFSYTSRFDRPLNNWDVTMVTDMSGMFQGSGFNQPIANWEVGNVTNMSAMFRESLFNHSIEIWNVSEVMDMSFMFHRHRTFNHPLNNWDVSNVTNLASMFDGWAWGAIYNQPLNTWDVSNVTNMNYMFRENSEFNQDISAWDVSAVTNMQGMFSETNSFNQDINGWEVANVTNMASMFQEAAVYNQPLEAWEVGNVTDMRNMFYDAPLFNQPLNDWDVDNVTRMDAMFGENPVFDQLLTDWNTAAVTNMSGMFQNAAAFDQNLETWSVSAITTMVNMLSNSGLSQENYDNALVGWAAQTVSSNVNLGAINLNYCDGRIARQDLIDNHNWTITGDIINCSFVLCTSLVSPLNGDTNVPASADLTWEQTPGATGYRVTVRITRDGVDSTPFDNYNIVGGNIVGLNLETPAGEDLLESGDEVFVTIVPYNDTDGPAVGCIEESFRVVPAWANSPEAFKLTYDTRLQEVNQTTPINQLRIQTRSGLSYNYSIDWGDGQFDNNVAGDITHTYLAPEVYTISIIGAFPAPRHADTDSDSFKLTSIDQWGTQPWQSMDSAFAGCENMEYNATDIPDLSVVENMRSMFIVCRNFNGDINSWNVSNVTNMSAMFGVTSIFNQPLNNWDVSNVTNMGLMFFRTPVFNQDITNWQTDNVTNMARMFEDADAFNQAINNWDVSSVTTMNKMFNRAEVFNQPLNSWIVSNVTDMAEMFSGTPVFNQNINSWNVGNVITMQSMFNSAEEFNQPLNSWNVASVTTMASMFSDASEFDQTLSSWNVSSVINMSSMFDSASQFNQNINTWDVTNVIDMRSMFMNASMYSQSMENWDVNSVVNMSFMFQRAEAFNQPLNSWEVSAVANMTSMFESASVFNQPLNSWDVSSVTLMNSMFEDAIMFNGEIGNWNVASVTTMEAMFKDARLFEQSINNWNTGEVQNMRELFNGASAFNQDINNWNTSFVTTMASMFENALLFNQSTNNWNVASVTTMENMFKGATVFNQDINSWNVRGVITMEEMFSGAATFNQSLNNWRMSGVSNMDYMFSGASAYNQIMNQWNLGTVSMRSTFFNATALNQYLGDWNISEVSNMSDMLDNTALVRENYDNTLIAWSEQTLTSGLTLGAEGLPFCDALEERQSMIDIYGWNITNDILDCPVPECTQLTSPLNGDMDVPLNTNLTWEPTLFARGYRLTVGTSSGGNDIINNETVNNTFYEFSVDFNTGDSVYVTLVPFNDTGDAVGPCAEENFDILGSTATIPNCTSLTEPLNSATNVAINTDLSWNPIANADGYRLTVGTATGAADIMNGVDVDNVTTFELTDDLPEDTDIFVSIIPYNEVGNAISCTEESFKTEIIPVSPACTQLLSPSNGTTGVPVDSELSWNAVDGATGYLVMVGTTQDGIEVANNIDVGNNNTFNFPDLLQQNRTHYVTIIPYNNIGDAMGCSEESFRTESSTLSDPPVCTTLSTPLGNTTDVPVATDITWNAAANTTGYWISVGTSSGTSDIYMGDVGNVTTLNLNDDLPENTEIFVILTPYNTFGDAVECSEESFTTLNNTNLPTCTSISSPLNNENNVSVSSNITWNAATGATGYRLALGTTAAGTDLFTGDVGNELGYNPTTDFEGNTIIFVTVVPYNSDGDAVGCTEESFTTENDVDLISCTMLNNPLNAETNVSVSSDISWNAIANATGYTLSIGTSSGASDIFTGDIGNTLSYDPITDLIDNSEIFVTVIPYNTDGNATGCTEESFITANIINLPNCTNLSSPLADTLDVLIGSTISWNPANRATGYRLTIGTSSRGTEVFAGDMGNTLNYTPLTALDENTIFFVTVIPYSEDGEATGCTEESFITEEIIEVPDCTTLNSPLANESGAPLFTTISWNDITNATGYSITIGTSSGGSEIFSGDVGDSINYQPTQDFTENTEIFVTVIPYNEDGNAVGCTEERFTTAIVPDITQYGFSPNGDGLNDHWVIDGIEDSPENTVLIYNRWGDIVFQVQGYDNASNVFRGMANKKMNMGANELPSGTYFFNIQVSGEHNLKKIQGYLVIKR